MPGIFGRIDSTGEPGPERLLADMAAALKEEAWYRVDLYREDGVGLGRVSLGLVDPEPQPVWNEDHTVCLVMEGEVFDYQDQKQRLSDSGHRFASETAAEFVLHLYEERGTDFVSQLNGAFAIAIWDKHENILIIANDRLGLHPIYFTIQGRGFAFAAGVRALLADSTLPRTVDLVAIAEMVTFDHVLGDRTLLGDVRLLPPGSLATFQDGRLDVHKYWTIDFPDAYEVRSEESYIEEYLFLLEQAVKRQVKGSSPTGLLLSGGLDSRVLLAFLAQHVDGRHLHTFTFGIPGCDDARFAREVATRAGAQHHYFELKPDYLRTMAERGVRLTDGLGNCVHMHSLATLSAETEYATILFKGFMGDALMGYGIGRELWTSGGTAARELQFRVYANTGGILFHPSEHASLLDHEVQRSLGGSVFEGFDATLAESGAALIADQRHSFDLRQRVPRMTLNGVKLVRSRGVVRLPYCDNDLVDFALRMPPWLRSERYLARKAFVKGFPSLAKVPYTETNLPLVPCARDLQIRFDTQVRWWLRGAGLKWVPAPRRRNYANYNLWMRTVLRDWVEGILLDQRTLERGYFNPGYVRQLVAEHMLGTNHAPKIGILLTLEIWHRQFIDNDLPAGGGARKGRGRAGSWSESASSFGEKVTAE